MNPRRTVRAVQAIGAIGAALDDARHLLERAVEIDAHYVDALVALAQSDALRSIASGSPEELRRAFQHAERAIALDPNNAEAMVWKGYAAWRLGATEVAWPAFRRAIELDPGPPTA